MSAPMYEIRTFDDGNQQYKQLLNIWYIIDKKFNGGKLILKNVKEPSIIINTISSWKVGKIIEFPE